MLTVIHTVCLIVSSSAEHNYHKQWTAEGSVFGAISLCFFVCVWNILGMVVVVCFGGLCVVCVW